MSQSNLSRLISPRSIAVVGHRGANFAIRESLKLGYTGQIWAIHPSREIPVKFGRFIHLGILLRG